MWCRIRPGERACASRFTSTEVQILTRPVLKAQILAAVAAGAVAESSAERACAALLLQKYKYGRVASQLSRLAVSLMAARSGRVPPFVSVDGYAWGRQAQEEMWEVAEELKAYTDSQRK